MGGGQCGVCIKHSSSVGHSPLMSDRISGMIPVTVLEGESLSLKDGKMCSVWYKMKEGAVYFGTQLITQKSLFPQPTSTRPPPAVVLSFIVLICFTAFWGPSSQLERRQQLELFNSRHESIDCPSNIILDCSNLSGCPGVTLMMT